MPTFIHYRLQNPEEARGEPVAIGEALAQAWRTLSLSMDCVPWWTMAEYALWGGYRKAARIEADDLEQAWHLAHVEETNKVTPVDGERPLVSTVGDVYEDVATEALWFCIGIGWAEMPDDVAQQFRDNLSMKEAA